jgi:MYXO-CTERM domain-containing protein
MEYMRDYSRRETRRSHRTVRVLALVLALSCLTGGAAAASVTAAVGDEIPLSGAAPGADVVYLFVTGPNLPTNGVRLDNIGSEVITGTPGSFTRATVTGTTWRYTWNTRTAGGTLDAGVYTVYVLTQPVGRRDLGDTDYASITVTLTRAGIQAEIGGEILVTSRPPAEVFLDGTPQGETPLRLKDLEPGSYFIELRAEGYTPVNGSVEVQAGRTTNFTRTLQAAEPEPEPPAVTETPSPAPTETPAPLAGMLAAGAVALTGLRRRR